MLTVLLICMAVAFMAGMCAGIAVTEHYWRDVIRALGQRRLGEPRQHVRPL